MAGNLLVAGWDLHEQVTALRRDISHVPALREGARCNRTSAFEHDPTAAARRTDIARGLNPSEHDKRLAGLVNRLRDGSGSFSFSLGTDDCRLAFLLCLFDDELCALGVLLRDLLLLDG
jgi:hypothetical protein